MASKAVFSVYEIVGPTGIYVGKTKLSAAARWAKHRNAAQSGSPQHLHRALRLYGVEAFSVTTVMQTETEVDAFACESARIAQRRAAGDVLYNMTDGGEGCSGWKAPKDWCVANGARKRGNTYMRGKRASAESRAKMSLAAKGRPQSEAQKAAIRAANTGRKMSPEHKAKMSQVHSGKTVSAETRAKLSAAAKARYARVEAPSDG